MVAHIETEEDYKEYQSLVEHGLRGLKYVSSGPCPGCDECGLGDCDDMNSEEYEMAHEPHFSYSGCDCCGRSLGGDRYPAHGFWTDDNGKEHLCHLDICCDCVHFMSYGQLDDMTMMDLEE